MTYTHTRIIIGITCVIFLMSCNILGSDPKSSDCGPGIIVPGKCIEGVKLGYTQEKVEELLGEPWNIGWTDGFYRSWRTYSYSIRGSQEPDLYISFFYNGEDQPWGPVDLMYIDKPYQGETPEGIGMGSTLEEVLKTFGTPENILEWKDGNGIEHGNYTWCYGSTRFTIGTTQDTVRLFFMGYHIPFPEGQDQDYRCDG